MGITDYIFYAVFMAVVFMAGYLIYWRWEPDG